MLVRHNLSESRHYQKHNVKLFDCYIEFVIVWSKNYVGNNVLVYSLRKNKIRSPSVPVFRPDFRGVRSGKIWRSAGTLVCLVFQIRPGFVQRRLNAFICIKVF